MSVLSSALDALAGIVGEEHLLTETQAVSEYGVEGQRPVAVAMPGSSEEVAALLRAASEQRLSVLIRGSGSHLHLGAPPGPMGLVVSLARLNQIVEYDADDLTVTAQAGMTLGALQQTVGEHGQVLPLDPSGPGSATLGGIAATNLSGPMRMRHGGPRDMVIGLRVALTDGTVVKTGGKTVKNVAGYEMNKLFVGSLGTVGAICELTMRLTPMPEAKAMMVASLAPVEAAEVAARLSAARLDVATLEVANHAACGRMHVSLPVTVEAGRWVVFAGLMGPREAIERQEREVRELVGRGCGRVDGEQADRLWGQLASVAYPADARAVVARSSVPMSRAAEVMELASSWDRWWTVTRAGDGMVYAGPHKAGDPAEVKRNLEVLRGRAEEAGGRLVLEAGPVELKREFAVWGDGGENLDLMRRLKESFDPGGILGCGRFLPGL